MTQDRRTLRALATLLPSGILGLSMSLAATDASAAKSGDSAPATPESVALRLEAIRNSVSVVVKVPMAGGKERTSDDDVQLAWWGNGWHNGGWGNGGLLVDLFGWHNGGWGNGGWHNGGWHNGGWHNGGWGNGGWHNGGWHNGGWGNGGWHNGGWHNGWHNW
jgi:hypothetical protein